MPLLAVTAVKRCAAEGDAFAACCKRHITLAKVYLNPPYIWTDVPGPAPEETIQSAGAEGVDIAARGLTHLYTASFTVAAICTYVDAVRASTR